MDNKKYTLEELLEIDTDNWVEGISNLSDEPGVMKEAYAMKGWKLPKKEEDYECPAELETELTCIAIRDNYRFDKNGKVVSFKKYHK